MLKKNEEEEEEEKLNGTVEGGMGEEGEERVSQEVVISHYWVGVKRLEGTVMGDGTGEGEGEGLNLITS